MVGVAVVAVFFSAYSIVLALAIIDDFSTTAKVGSTWHTTVDTSAGVARLQTLTCDNGVWYCSLNNVVADTLGDGSFVIVARADLASAAWKSTNTACDRPQCGTDGGQDGDNLVADNTTGFSAYPARDACKQIGGRLPTKAELQAIYTNRASFGTFSASYYWSATEYDAAGAWYVYWSNGDAYYGNEVGTFGVRCVAGW
jgi:hypothetical protein